MTGNDDFRVRPGRIRSTRAARAKPFLAQALQAAQKAGGLSRAGRKRGSTFGRGRAVSLAASRLLNNRARGAIVKARVVRQMRSPGALRAHIGDLQRDGGTRDGRHLMVSRQETTRPLLTPGEVMQLSRNEAIVMISGMRPVRARKVRYYEDPQFLGRILKPSHAVPIANIARSDEWSGRSAIAPSVKLLAALKKKACDQNGGLRREPELPQQEEVVLPSPLADSEFDAASDEGDADVLQAAALTRSMQGLARAVSLDPDDKMGL